MSLTIEDLWLQGRFQPNGRQREAIAALALLGVTTVPLPVRAGTCMVPGSHATIQAAINDPSCTTIDLANQTYSESVLVSRSLTIASPSGGSATIEGLVAVEGSGTVVALDDLGVQNGCSPEALRVQGGAEVNGTNLQVTRAAALPWRFRLPSLRAGKANSHPASFRNLVDFTNRARLCFEDTA
jgi:hypothetical protein